MWNYKKEMRRFENYSGHRSTRLDKLVDDRNTRKQKVSGVCSWMEAGSIHRTRDCWMKNMEVRVGELEFILDMVKAPCLLDI